jgi:heme/copper-type cytochrome/quinol oxidase subunit 2
MPKKEAKKNLWLAVLLAILVGGAGHDYNRKDKKAAVFFIVFVASIILVYTPYQVVGFIGLLVWMYSIYDSYNLTKITIHEKPRTSIVWFVVAFYLLFVVLPFSLGFFGRIMTANSAQAESTSQFYDANIARLSSISNEYSNYTELVNSDIPRMNDRYNNWADTYNDAIKDNQLTSSEVLTMGSAINEYALEYKIVRQHWFNFKEFVVINENDLKTLDVDTFKIKTQIDDTLIGMENNVDRMKTSTQALVELDQQNKQQLLDYLRILSLLA